MRTTEDLIATLTAGDIRPRTPMPRPVSIALVAGGLVSLAAFLLTIGIRPDVAAALGTWRFVAKLVVVLVALVSGLTECLRLTSPVESGFASRRSLVLPAFVLALVGLELAAVPVEDWGVRLVGTNALVCLTWIPLLSLAPLAAGLLALRAGAPTSPATAGAAAGRLAAAVAATLYALHCTDDSPLFVAVWYSLATLPVIALGGIAGSRMLRW